MTIEVEEATKEGIQMEFMTAPIRILTEDNQLTGIQCVRMALGDYDASGRQSAMPVKGSEFNISVDNILVAVGESVDKAMLPKELEFTNVGTLYVHPHTLQTNVSGVFAGGDVVTGPSDVIRAIAIGKEAAVSIDRYLKGADVMKDRFIAPKVLYASTKRDTKNRVVTITDEKTARAEANRCLNCGICGEAIERGLQTACVNVCPSHCIYYRDIWEITPKTGTYRVA
jgi:NADPH-dependent glutamate synthase beta subunit-like oxidoreductase